ncbi:chemotaxis response regulator protein-glutamate methylesterase [Paenibacillus septentrionalis]|uniref:Protein-glutamate methylesterase/protein-glutamine glutaminase n=1 Tax=Paenibacillus septentrionalis TaxID=429342 RepID=A0ABW1V289_9BACL
MKIKVLAVDDSAFMRKLIGKIVQSDPMLELVDTAVNGQDAIEKTIKYKPNVITMDVEMPVMNGIEAVRVLMKKQPTPIIMLSSLTQEGASETIEALEAGAIDFVHKPSGSISIDIHKVEQELLLKIKTAAKVTPRSPLAMKRVPITTKHNHAASSIVRQLVAIGASTGGPQALTSLLSSLPADFSHPLLIVQHMPQKFTAILSERLNNLSSLHVKEASHGDVVRNGWAYIAPGDYHMNVVRTNGRLTIALHQEERRGLHRPSVDELFASVNKLTDLKRHYVLLTGMGRDGAEKMHEAKQLGAASTIAEHKDSCIVYGMPRAAVELGAVEHIVPLEKMSEKIQEVTSRQ